jgi:hypothetical protein
MERYACGTAVVHIVQHRSMSDELIMNGKSMKRERVGKMGVI